MTMVSYNNRELINLTELGQYLKSVFEFCFLQNELKNIYQIKWNIQWLDLSITLEGKRESQEFFLEIVIVLNTLTLNQVDKDSIIQTLNSIFTIQLEQETVREVNGNAVLIIGMRDTQKERFNLKTTGKGIPEKYKKYDVTISIESQLRDLFPSPKLILSSDDILNEEKKVINELIGERSNIQAKLNAIQKPIIVCEGKTDVKIIGTAWKKLYSGKEIPFQIVPSGVWIEIDKSEGNADQVRRLLELYAPINPEGKTCIGLFDNDKEGNEQFKGLNGKIFELHQQITTIKRHKKHKVYGMLLPVPSFRQKYFGKLINHRFFEIEHYFSDEILKKNNMIGDTITPDSAIFTISGDKTKFSDSIIQLDKKEFECMTILFDELDKIICC